MENEIDLPTIIEKQSKLIGVVLTPKCSEPIPEFDFYDHMKLLAIRYGIENNLKHVGRAVNIERAQADGKNAFSNNNYITYTIGFDKPITAHHFVHKINEDGTLLYKAHLSDGPVSLASFSPIKKLK